MTRERPQPQEDTKLPREQSLVLLRKLSDDDLFRHHFESDPAQALRDIGVSDRLIGKAKGLKPMKLAPKSVFLEALLLLIDEVLCIYLSMIFPCMQISSSVNGKARTSEVLFEAP
jgi:putative modified peptide